MKPNIKSVGWVKRNETQHQERRLGGKKCNPTPSVGWVERNETQHQERRLGEKKCNPTSRA